MQAREAKTVAKAVFGVTLILVLDSLSHRYILTEAGANTPR